MQNDEAAVALPVFGQQRGELLPVRRGDVGAVDQWVDLQQVEAGQLLQAAAQLLLDTLAQTGGRCQPMRAGHHADGAAGVQDQHLGGHEAAFCGASMDCGLSRRLSSDSLIRFSSMISALTVLPVISAVWAMREALL